MAVGYTVHAPNAITWKTRIETTLGYRMIPVLRWRGEHLQDSAQIIDRVADDLNIEVLTPSLAQRAAAELLHQRRRMADHGGHDLPLAKRRGERCVDCA